MERYFLTLLKINWKDIFVVSMGDVLEMDIVLASMEYFENTFLNFYEEKNIFSVFIEKCPRKSTVSIVPLSFLTRIETSWSMHFLNLKVILENQQYL